MKPYNYTVAKVRAASDPIADEPWKEWDNSRELAGKGEANWCGRVSVHRNHREDDGTGYVSLELYALSCEQAEAILGFLSRKRDDRVTYDIPGPEVGRG